VIHDSRFVIRFAAAFGGYDTIVTNTELGIINSKKRGASNGSFFCYLNFFRDQLLSFKFLSMKKLFIIFLVIFGLFVIMQSFIYYSSSSIEKHAYKVLKEYDEFEVRQYETALFSSVVLADSTFEESSNKGFRVLAGYIFGGNDTGEKIEMTSPVAMEIGDSTKMSFMVPSGYTEETLPKPNNDKIFFEKKEGAVMAAIRFGGWANDERIKEYKQKLITLLQKEGIAYGETFMYLGYDPPYAVFNRRNEIVVELKAYK